MGIHGGETASSAHLTRNIYHQATLPLMQHKAILPFDPHLLCTYYSRFHLAISHFDPEGAAYKGAGGDAWNVPPVSRAQNYQVKLSLLPHRIFTKGRGGYKYDYSGAEKTAN